MGRLTISIPDDLIAAVEAADLDVSELALKAIRSDLDRRAKLDAFEEYFAELEAELGPMSAAEREESERFRAELDRAIAASKNLKPDA